MERAYSRFFTDFAQGRKSSIRAFVSIVEGFELKNARGRRTVAGAGKTGFGI
jgi:hypothetical protein